MTQSDQSDGEIHVDAAGTKPSDKKVCGIVMPIAAMGDLYSEEHWRRVQKILRRAIERADMSAQLVWENAEVDVIQSAILQNLYENDIVICDVSGLNPNVMLEAGLRLSTKRPTVIITDRVLRPPFDIGTIGYIEYQRDLEYNAIEDFISRLSRKLEDVSTAYDNGKYKSFAENYQFETVTPEKVSVSGEKIIYDQLRSIQSSLAKLERSPNAQSIAPVLDIQMPRATVFDVNITKAFIRPLHSKIMDMSVVNKVTHDELPNGKCRFTLHISPDVDQGAHERSIERIRGVIGSAELGSQLEMRPEEVLV